MANLRRIPSQVVGSWNPPIITTLSRFGRNSSASLITHNLFGFTVGAAATTITQCYASAWFAGDTLTPANAVGAPNGVFTTNTGAVDWYGQWSMTAPPAPLGGRLQTVRIHCRSSAASYSYPESLDIYYNNVVVGAGTLCGINDVLGTRSVVVTFTFDGSILTSLDLVQFGIYAVNGGDAVQVDAIEWVANHDLVSAGGGAVLKYWNGSAWVAKPLKYWNGSAWVAKPLKYWNGSAWVG